MKSRWIQSIDEDFFVTINKDDSVQLNFWVNDGKNDEFSWQLQATFLTPDRAFELAKLLQNKFPL